MKCVKNDRTFTNEMVENTVGEKGKMLITSLAICMLMVALIYYSSKADQAGRILFSCSLILIKPGRKGN